MIKKTGVEMWSFLKVKGQFNLRIFYLRLFKHELFNPMVQKLMVEKSGAEKFTVEKSVVEKSRVEKSFNPFCSSKSADKLLFSNSFVVNTLL